MVGTCANAARGALGCHHQSGRSDVHLGIAVCVTIHNAGACKQADKAATGAGNTRVNGFQRDAAAAGLQADVTTVAADGARGAYVVLRQGDVATGQVVNGLANGLAGDIGVLQDVLRGIQAEMAVAQDHIGIELDICTSADGFEQHVTVADLDTQGADIGIALAHHNRASGSLQNQVTSDQQVRLSDIGGARQGATVAAHTVDGERRCLASADGRGFAEVDTAVCNDRACAHVGTEFAHLSLKRVAVGAYALAVGDGIQAQFVGINIYRAGHSFGDVIQNAAAAADQANRSPWGGGI